MKKLQYFVLVISLAVIAVSCHKDPPKTYDDTDMTVTLYNTDFNFDSYNTFVMPDSTVLKTDIEDYNVEYFYREGSTSDQTLELVRQTFLNLGYQEVDSLADADFIPVPTLLMVQKQETVYYTPGWWWGYPGYGWGWGWYYKGTEYYYYYPVYPWYPAYPVTVSTYVGTVVVEMLDAESYREILAYNENNPDPDPDEAPDMEVNWQAFVEGYLTTDGDYNSERAQRGLSEAVAQSPYLGK